MNNEQEILLLDWMRKIHQLEYAHRFESLKWNDWNYWLGIPSLIIGSVIGAVSAFCDIENTIKNVILSFGGIIIAILTGLQTFLKPQELSEKHKIVSSNYEKIRHQIEYLIVFEKENNVISIEIEKIRNEWNSIETLNASESNFIKAKKRVEKFEKYPKELGFLKDQKNN